MTSPTPPICCEKQDYNCNQGRTCRQRAGKPADYNSPVWLAKTEAELEAELQRQFKRDLKAIAFIGACILSFWLVVWGTLP